MSLSELLNQRRPTKPDRWQLLIDSLDDADRAALEAAMRDPLRSTASIWRALQAIDCDPGKNILYDTRREYLEGRR